MSSTLKYENVWTDKAKYDDAERQYYERLAKASLTPLADEVAKARQRLIDAKNAYENIPLQCALPSNADIKAIENKLENFEKTLLSVLQKIEKLEVQVAKLEKVAAPSVANKTTETTNNANANKPAAAEEEDDGVDLFASDSEDESAEAAKVREERLAAYNAKKSKKPALIAKSNVILEVKPWDDETDMAKMEEEVRKISTDGLLWGASKLVPLAYGIRKLQISCVVEDEKVSIDWLTEEIEKIEDYVQSADVLAFNKI